MKGELGFIGTVEKAEEQEAEARISPEFCAGVKGIDDFSHTIIIYWAHLRDIQQVKTVFMSM